MKVDSTLSPYIMNMSETAQKTKPSQEEVLFNAAASRSVNDLAKTLNQPEIKTRERLVNAMMKDLC